MQLFQDITVVPTQHFNQRISRGGPIWPNFDHQIIARHCRKGQPVDVRPETPESPLAKLTRPCVWGGLLDRNFGHLIAEHLPRIPLALQERPNDTYVFTVEPDVTKDALPNYIWDVLEWYGLRSTQVHIVTEPVHINELRVNPQEEMLPNIGPSQTYLNALSKIAERRALVPIKSNLLYVTRAGMPSKGAGGHIGEKHLVSVLQKLGVDILDPATASIHEKLALYAGAKHIVFAEGSALHGRQMLGWHDQYIHVLRRRPKRWLAKKFLAPRCQSIQYYPTNGEMLMGYFKSGNPNPNPSLTLYDLTVLFRVFNHFGLDIRAHWDHQAYVLAAVADVFAWIKARQSTVAHISEYITTLRAAGIDLNDPVLSAHFADPDSSNTNTI